MMDPFDKEGDSLLNMITDNDIRRQHVMHFVNHPNLLRAAFRVVAKSINNTPIRFQAKVHQVTRNVHNEDTIVFKDVIKQHSRSYAYVYPIRMDDILEIEPVSTDRYLFEALDVLEPVQIQKSDCSHLDKSSATALYSDDIIFAPQKSSTMDTSSRRDIPLLSTGKVDLFLLNLWYTEEHSEGLTKETFSEWRDSKGYTAQMKSRKLTFASPASIDSVKNDPQLQTNLQRWKDSYPKHRLNFEDWHSLSILENDTSNKCTCCVCLNYEGCTCCTCNNERSERLLKSLSNHRTSSSLSDLFRSQAETFLEKLQNSPKKETSYKREELTVDTPMLSPSTSFTIIEGADNNHSTELIRTDTSESDYITPAQATPPRRHVPEKVNLIKVANHIFKSKIEDTIADQWLELQNSKEAAEVVTQWHSLGGYQGLHVTFKTFINTTWPWHEWVQLKAEKESDCFSPQSDGNIFKEVEITNMYDSPGESCTDILNKIQNITRLDFLPNGNLAHVYIPSYNYIPEDCILALGLKEVKMSATARTLLWHALQKLRVEAQEHITEDHLSNIVANGWTKYLLENAKKDGKTTHLIDAIQHSEAIRHNNKFNLNVYTVYDTLFRPMERLCGIEMPLHKDLILARFNMKSRRWLFESLLNLIQFKRELSINHHDVFRNLTWIRHLSSHDLTVHNKFHTGPVLTIQPLEAFESDPSEKPLDLPTKTSIQNYLSTLHGQGKLNFKMPLEIEQMKEFKQIGGIFMSIRRQKELVALADKIKGKRGATPKPTARNLAQNTEVKPDLILCEVSQMEEHTETQPTYSEITKQQQQQQQQQQQHKAAHRAPPIPRKPLPTKELQVFPFLHRSKQQ